MPRCIYIYIYIICVCVYGRCCFPIASWPVDVVLVPVGACTLMTNLLEAGLVLLVGFYNHMFLIFSQTELLNPSLLKIMVL